jgi:hypothetical protein
MIADSQQSGRLASLLDRLRERVPDLARDLAADLGGSDPHQAESTVLRFLDMIGGGPGLGEADRLRLRQEGASAARMGQPLAASMDAYLSTAWVTWDHALDLEPPLEVAAMRSLGAALLRAGDDIAAALSDGYTAAERALAATAGAARQAILDELLTQAPSDSATLARVLRRAALAGLDPTHEHHLLVLRTGSERESPGELVEELARRLARDPVRRPHLVAARGPDLVALAGLSWRDGRPFAEPTADLTDEPWWAVVAGPMPLEGVARAYVEAVDALRVAPLVLPVHALVPVTDLALERALVADPVLAAAGVDRWLGPLAGAPRGGPELVRTLTAWLGSGQSVTATARALAVAPRTVSYRLERIAVSMGMRALDPDTVARLSAALLVARLLGRDPAGSDL